MREIVEREIDEGRVLPRPPGRGKRSVKVNLAESPLSWLRARGHLDARRFEAGERIREDYEMASLSARVTMCWDSAPRAPGRRGPPEAMDPTLASIAARRRFDAAMGAVGSGLADIIWRVVCNGEGLALAEKGLGWPSRAGKLVLGLALDRLAEHYGLP